MSMKGSDPAFPVHVHNDSREDIQMAGHIIKPNYNAQFFGISVRDYFAAKAMQSLIIRDGCTTGYAKKIAEDSFAYADAMLRAGGGQ